MSYSNSVSLAYRGDVKLTVSQGNTILETKQYKNAGTLPLFRFLGNCLIGNFQVAAKLRPFKIKLLIDPSDSPVQGENVSTDLPAYTEASNFIFLAQAPELTTFGSEINGSCQVKFSYIFPIANVFESGANTIAIYGVDETEPTRFCAFHKLTKTEASETGTGNTITWDPIKLTEEDYENNKIFALEWTMTITNR